MKKQCIAITGACGSIGQALVATLSEQPLRLLSRSYDKLKACFPSRGIGELCSVDYSIDQLRSSLSGVDCLVHLAASRPGTEEETLETYRDNIFITDSLYQVCRELNICNVVYASSTAVYSSINTIPYEEREIAGPANFYALSKLIGESLGELYGLKQKALRIASVIAPDENPAYMRMAFIHKALKGQDLNIYAVSHREYIYYKDVVAAIVLALNKPELSGVFNIGSGVSVSNLDYAQSVNQVLAQGTLNIHLTADCCENGENHVMACDKARCELGFAAGYSLDAALREIGEDLRARL
ncbi:NAD(P)-dependent oxidoreductase [uncultured Desulfuromonas sp.]|uniref:NAD-dependent epimerase/dehydratase family protein n=1 Tax=uncultured Desulfuromonas sp. TaxID=181013 RepID=UPI002AABDC4D|nr:NAD(P)-dependent oxidoreductase [uncultured Desulfuromonas sp.]